MSANQKQNKSMCFLVIGSMILSKKARLVDQHSIIMERMQVQFFFQSRIFNHDSYTVWANLENASAINLSGKPFFFFQKEIRKRLSQKKKYHRNFEFFSWFSNIFFVELDGNLFSDENALSYLDYFCNWSSNMGSPGCLLSTKVEFVFETN